MVSRGPGLAPIESDDVVLPLACLAAPWLHGVSSRSRRSSRSRTERGPRKAVPCPFFACGAQRLIVTFPRGAIWRQMAAMALTGRPAPPMVPPCHATVLWTVQAFKTRLLLLARSPRLHAQGSRGGHAVNASTPQAWWDSQGSENRFRSDCGGSTPGGGSVSQRGRKALFGAMGQRR